MLTEQERAFIDAQLGELVMRVPSPRQAIVAALHPELAAVLPEGLAPYLLVARAIELCEQDGYSKNPAALVRLLTTLLGEVARVTEIVARVRTPPPPPPDPFEALILDNKLPFLDRKPTRAYLRALTKEKPPQPLVVINGSSKSGKSYTGEFIDHVCGHLKDVQHCRIELAQKQGASTGPAELASDIVTYVGGDPQKAPPPNTNLERWTQELANWIIAEAGRSKFRWWFVLDGFNKAELREDTRMLIAKVAKALTTGVAQRLHRLILIDFDRTTLPLQPGLIASDQTGGIPISAVEAAARHLLATSGGTLDGPQIIARIKQGFSDPVTDLPEVAQRLGDLMAVLEGAPS